MVGGPKRKDYGNYIGTCHYSEFANGGAEGMGLIKKIYRCDNQVVSATFCEGPNAGREMKLFRIRGWGMLTDSGGFHLSAEKAIEIQDAFVAYCVDMLNKCE